MTNLEKIMPLLSEKDFIYWKKHEEVNFQNEISNKKPFEIIKNFLEFDYSDYWYSIYYDILMKDDTIYLTNDDKLRGLLKVEDYNKWLYYSNQKEIYEETDLFPHEILKKSFRWNQTKEGFYYWKIIYYYLLNYYDQQTNNEKCST